MKIFFIVLLAGLILVSGCTQKGTNELDKQSTQDNVESEVEENTETSSETKLIVFNPIDISQIKSISKFRSCAGHDYSGTNTQGQKEALRSMKHYLNPLPELLGSDKIKVYSPFDGIVNEVGESFPGNRVLISSSKDRSWNFIFFHIALNPEMKQGNQVKAGQLIGYVSPDSKTNFDIGLKQFGITGQ